MHLFLGEYLVRAGTITGEQRDQILGRQAETGRPFGALAEEMFGVRPESVERAWAEQYADLAEWVDPVNEMPDAAALDAVARRQAWQFRCLPLRFESNGELLVCTTKDNLPRALRFAGWRIAQPCAFVLAAEGELSAALAQYYPIDGLAA